MGLRTDDDGTVHHIIAQAASGEAGIQNGSYCLVSEFLCDLREFGHLGSIENHLDPACLPDTGKDIGDRKIIGGNGHPLLQNLVTGNLALGIGSRRHDYKEQDARQQHPGPLPGNCDCAQQFFHNVGLLRGCRLPKPPTG